MVRRAVGLFAIVCVVLLVVSLAIYWTTPRRNTTQQRFDTLIVLGAPALPDGTPSPDERARVLGAVEEYRAGHAAHLILTGGAAHNRYIEGNVMAEAAIDDGVPASAIVVEGQSHNTIENIWFSRQIMQAHGWRSAEVISDGAHLHRAGMILARYDGTQYRFDWSTHVSDWAPEYTRVMIAEHILYEWLAVNDVRWFGFPPTPYLPRAEK